MMDTGTFYTLDLDFCMSLSGILAGLRKIDTSFCPDVVECPTIPDYTSRSFLFQKLLSNMATKRECDRIMKDRKMGLYNSIDTKTETELVVTQLEPTDKVFTLIHRIGMFSMYNSSEFLPQLKQWKELNCKLLKCNVFERVIKGKVIYMFIIQPTDLEKAAISPLALAYDVMVSGFAYMTPHKSIIDLVLRVLE
jgi:hypothetical protein